MEAEDEEKENCGQNTAEDASAANDDFLDCNDLLLDAEPGSFVQRTTEFVHESITTTRIVRRKDNNNNEENLNDDDANKFRVYRKRETTEPRKVRDEVRRGSCGKWPSHEFSTSFSNQLGRGRKTALSTSCNTLPRGVSSKTWTRSSSDALRPNLTRNESRSAQSLSCARGRDWSNSITRSLYQPSWATSKEELGGVGISKVGGRSGSSTASVVLETKRNVGGLGREFVDVGKAKEFKKEGEPQLQAQESTRLAQTEESSQVEKSIQSTQAEGSKQVERSLQADGFRQSMQVESMQSLQSEGSQHSTQAEKFTSSTLMDGSKQSSQKNESLSSSSTSPLDLVTTDGGFANFATASDATSKSISLSRNSTLTDLEISDRSKIVAAFLSVETSSPSSTASSSSSDVKSSSSAPTSTWSSLSLSPQVSSDGIVVDSAGEVSDSIMDLDVKRQNWKEVDEKSQRETESLSRTTRDGSKDNSSRDEYYGSTLGIEQPRKYFDLHKKIEGGTDISFDVQNQQRVYENAQEKAMSQVLKEITNESHYERLRRAPTERPDCNKAPLVVPPKPRRYFRPLPPPPPPPLPPSRPPLLEVFKFSQPFSDESEIRERESESEEKIESANGVDEELEGRSFTISFAPETLEPVVERNEIKSSGRKIYENIEDVTSAASKFSSKVIEASGAAGETSIHSEKFLALNVSGKSSLTKAHSQKFGALENLNMNESRYKKSHAEEAGDFLNLPSNDNETGQSKSYSGFEPPTGTSFATEGGREKDHAESLNLSQGSSMMKDLPFYEAFKGFPNPSNAAIKSNLKNHSSTCFESLENTHAEEITKDHEKLNVNSSEFSDTRTEKTRNGESWKIDNSQRFGKISSDTVNYQKKEQQTSTASTSSSEAEYPGHSRLREGTRRSWRRRRFFAPFLFGKGSFFFERGGGKDRGGGSGGSSGGSIDSRIRADESEKPAKKSRHDEDREEDERDVVVVGSRKSRMEETLAESEDNRLKMEIEITIKEIRPEPAVESGGAEGATSQKRVSFSEEVQAEEDSGVWAPNSITIKAREEKIKDVSLADLFERKMGESLLFIDDDEVGGEKEEKKRNQLSSKRRSFGKNSYFPRFKSRASPLAVDNEDVIPSKISRLDDHVTRPDFFKMAAPIAEATSAEELEATIDNENRRDRNSQVYLVEWRGEEEMLI